MLITHHDGGRNAIVNIHGRGDGIMERDMNNGQVFVFFSGFQ